MTEKTIIIKEYNDGRKKKIILDGWIDEDKIKNELNKKKIRNVGCFYVIKITDYVIYLTQYPTGIRFSEMNSTIDLTHETASMIFNEISKSEVSKK